MSTEQNKATIRRWAEELWNQGNFAVTSELITEDFVCHHVPQRGEVQGREGHDQWVRAVRDDIPGFHVEIRELVAEGDRVASYWWTQGPGMHLYRLVEGKIAEMWAVF